MGSGKSSGRGVAEAADGLEPVVPQRAPAPVVSPGPAKGKHKGAAKGSTAN